MLAQGQSSSAKRRGLAADVSSGLVFLKKNKKKNPKKLHTPKMASGPLICCRIKLIPNVLERIQEGWCAFKAMCPDWENQHF